MRRFLLTTAALLAACQAEGPDEEGIAGPNDVVANFEAIDAAGGPDRPVSGDDPQSASPPTSDGPTSDCPIVKSSDWRAHVDAMPGPNDNPRLIVSGKVTVPTGGYQLTLRMGAIAESYPVQVTVHLDVVPPKGPATQALETREVRGSWPSEQRVGSVSIRCGGRTLARLANIETAN